MTSPTGRLRIHHPPLQVISKEPINPVIQKAIDLYGKNVVIDTFLEWYNSEVVEDEEY